MEPVGIEPTTSCLQSRRSPTELRPRAARYMARTATACARSPSSGRERRHEGVEGAAAVADGVLLGGGHLGEGAVVRRRGRRSGRSRSRGRRAGVSIRRAVDAALEEALAAVGQGQAQRRPRTRRAWSAAAKLPKRLGEAVQHLARWRDRSRAPGRPSGPSGCPGAPSRPWTTMPLSSASAGRPVASAAARALSRALAAKLSPVSSGSGRPSAAAPTTSIPCGSQQILELAQLARIVGGDQQPLAVDQHPSACRCRADQRGDAAGGQRAHGLELLGADRARPRR